MPGQLPPALLHELIDYAGLFPPAKLDMPSAVEEFARHRRSADAWMLARFVVPAARLDPFEAAAGEHLPRREGAAPWRLSVLPGDDLEGARRRIDAFNAAHGEADTGLAVVDAVEYKPAGEEDIARAARLFSDLEVYFELPHGDDPSSLMAVVARHRGRAKIRSGGVTADAFPTAAQVARFLAAARRAGIPLKATAGLHHPLRGEYRLTYEDGSPSGSMHGFLNVFLAAAWARAGLAEGDLVTLLEERDPAAFTFAADRVGWRGHNLDFDTIRAAREQFALSFGSCSFAEPVEDLRRLELLPDP